MFDDEFARSGSREASMNFQDRRLWYVVAAVVVVLLVVYACWPATEVTAPAATQ
jgi:hypothetical protein